MRKKLLDLYKLLEKSQHILLKDSKAEMGKYYRSNICNYTIVMRCADVNWTNFRGHIFQNEQYYCCSRKYIAQDTTAWDNGKLN